MQNKRNFYYGHGGSGNHGCEAIVRSSATIFCDRPSIAASFRPGEDKKYSIDQVCTIIKKDEVPQRQLNASFLYAYLMLKMRGDYGRLDQLAYINFLSSATQGDIAFSIGGDNYCYSRRACEKFRSYRKFLKKRGAKTVLWGCSVEPDMIDSRMRKDLSRYDLITARESITYETLRKINSNVVLAPDPAFTLRKQPGNYPEGLGSKPYIGINVSPLIQSLEKGGNITMENYRALVAHILETTDRDIALIPHVVWDHNDDRIPLGQLYEEFRNTGRVFMVEDQNCMQLKDIISGCEFFVGARTHATIAAYSTCVPTLVVGYSVKARGIARDLFGSEEGYVLPVQQLRNSGELTDAFHGLYSRKEEIREYLSNMMPDYIAGIEAAKEAVERL